MEPVLIAAAASLVVGLVGGGGLVAWYRAGAERRVDDAEAAKRLADAEHTQVDTAMTIVQGLVEEVARLKSEAAVRDQEVKALREETAQCHRDRDRQAVEIERMNVRIDHLTATIEQLTGDTADGS